MVQTKKPLSKKFVTYLQSCPIDKEIPMSNAFPEFSDIVESMNNKKMVYSRNELHNGSSKYGIVWCASRKTFLKWLIDVEYGEAITNKAHKNFLRYD